MTLSAKNAKTPNRANLIHKQMHLNEATFPIQGVLRDSTSDRNRDGASYADDGTYNERKQ